MHGKNCAAGAAGPREACEILKEVNKTVVNLLEYLGDSFPAPLLTLEFQGKK
jgi:hypothetical protein